MTEDFYADPEICQAILMDYYKNPRCSGVCNQPTHAGEATNPACGDIVKLSFEIVDGRIICARTTGAGCAVSQATASLLAERLQGLKVTEATEVLASLNGLLSRHQGSSANLEQLNALRLIINNPARIRCAGVAGEAALKALVGTA